MKLEKWKNSSKKIVNSSNGLKEHLNDITPINKIFESKMNSIINKIELEYTKINSALNGYTYTFLEGGNMHNNHILDFARTADAFHRLYKGSDEVIIISGMAIFQFLCGHCIFSIAIFQLRYSKWPFMAWS